MKVAVLALPLQQIASQPLLLARRCCERVPHEPAEVSKLKQPDHDEDEQAQPCLVNHAGQEAPARVPGDARAQKTRLHGVSGHLQRLDEANENVERLLGAAGSILQIVIVVPPEELEVGRADLISLLQVIVPAVLGLFHRVDPQALGERKPGSGPVQLLLRRLLRPQLRQQLGLLHSQLLGRLLHVVEHLELREHQVHTVGHL
mmetsp:Transcript_12949/g.29432  ORF Transcript_12949/g.29432 Transcript_12949/m.29432 type:complete len:203 (-) Transcript_12949:471-1079(-)